MVTGPDKGRSDAFGPGELEIAGREHRQPIGRRIDFLMRDAEAETYYEVIFSAKRWTGQE